MGTCCLLSASLLGEELHPQRTPSQPLYAPSEVRDLSDGAGGTVRIEVSVPQGKRLDPRIFDLLTVQGQNGAATALSQRADAASKSAVAPLDVSGYQISVTALTADASCSASNVIRWSSGIVLSPNQSLTLTVMGSPEQLQATTYPQGGDVNLHLYSGGTLLAFSTQPPGYLDTAGVISASCLNEQTSYNVVISNPSAVSSARFVGVISQVLVQ